MPFAATPSVQSLPQPLQRCLAALDDKKAENLQLLYVGEISSVTDYYVIATGTSSPHLKALARAAQESLEDSGEEALFSGGGEETGWVVVDAIDLMVHLFAEETRSYFNLEGLWKDGERIEVMETVGR